MNSNRARLGRAATLLVKLSVILDDESVAQELVISQQQLFRYRSGGEDIPQSRQLCLALFLVQKVPLLARGGRALLGQIAATAAYQANETQVHNGSPAGAFAIRKPHGPRVEM